MAARRTRPSEISSAGISHAVSTPAGAGSNTMKGDAASMLMRTMRPSFTSAASRSEEHTSELQSLMRISYAVFCLQKKKHTRLICIQPAAMHRCSYHAYMTHLSHMDLRPRHSHTTVHNTETTHNR